MYICAVFGLLFCSVMAKTVTVGLIIRKRLRLYSKFVSISERRRFIYYICMFSFSCHGFVLWLLLHTFYKESSKTIGFTLHNFYTRMSSYITIYLTLRMYKYITIQRYNPCRFLSRYQFHTFRSSRRLFPFSGIFSRLVICKGWRKL